MNIIKPMLLAAALLSPFAAAAQTPTTETAEPADTPVTTPLPGMSREESKFDKERMDLQTEIAEIRRELTDLKVNSSSEGTEKLNSLSMRVDDLENRALNTVDDREFKENKHKFKNELKKIRKDLKSARKHRTSTLDSTQPAPIMP